jgi:acetyl-CoA carboxylase biotin carboxyl carrier protein
MEADLVDLDDLRELADFMAEYDLTELAVKDTEHGRSVRMRRGPEPAPSPPAPTPVAPDDPVPPDPADDDDAEAELIRAPMVGTFYRAPRPGDDSFVEAGSAVSEGDVLCVVEAMKLMNLIEAEYACEIVEILVDNAAAVEYGEPLFRIRRR